MNAPILQKQGISFLMPKFECAAILFDMDGVLVDSTAAVAGTWGRWALAHSLDPQLVIDGAHGRRTIETVREFAPHLDADAEANRIESAEAMELDTVTVIPGALQLLRSLPEGLWGVVTSATRPMALTRLRDAGYPIPRVLVTADDVIHGKPNPEPYLKGAAGLGIASDQCIVFEDSPAGIRAANAARMRVIGLLTTYPPEALHQAQAKIADFTKTKVERNGSGKLEIVFAE
jgi:sugar-phosphatase